MWSRPLVRYGILASSAIAGTGLYQYKDELRLRVAQTLTSERPVVNEDDWFTVFPRKKWDFNWDQRDPMSLVDPKAYEAADPEKRKAMLEKHKPTATRHVFLIRHGQYHLDSEKKNLTPLGIEQAALLGERLAKTGIKYDVCIMSTMNRATETATLMLEKMDPTIPRSSDSIIEEGSCYPPEPPLAHWKPSQRKFHTEGARIEAAFRKHIHRASAKQKGDSYELIVCHANVIRYFICRALQFPREGWLRLALANTSITWLVLRPNGAVSCRCIGDYGHLPQDKVSFT